MPNNNKSNNNKSGFTLIELLVVITVIGVLSGVLLGVINSSGVRAKARDSQRKADLKKIQTALELYFADFRAYPGSDSGNGNWEQVDGSSSIDTALDPNYIDPVPQDPKGGGTEAEPCDDETSYRYNYISDGSYYYLTAIMEVETSKDDSPCGDSFGGCGAGYATLDYCYVAQNP